MEIQNACETQSLFLSNFKGLVGEKKTYGEPTI
jgi:hypothetical protein